MCFEYSSTIFMLAKIALLCLAAHDYKNVSLLEAYNAIHHYDLICVEKYLTLKYQTMKKIFQSRETV